MNRGFYKNVKEMIIRGALIVWIFLGWISPLWAEPPPWLVVSDLEIRPDPEVHSSWLSNIFNADVEILVVDSQSQFIRTLEEHGANVAHINALARRLHFSVPDSMTGTRFSFYGRTSSLPSGGRFLLLEDRVKEDLPPLILNRVYQYLFESDYAPPHLSFAQRRFAEREIRSWRLPVSLQKRTINSIVSFKKQSRVPISPLLWAHLPDQVKNLFIDQRIEPLHDSRRGLSIQIDLSRDADIQKVAKSLAGPIPQNELVRRLRRYVNRGFLEDRLLVPIERLLPPFVGYALNRYHPEGGPNCYNCGLSFNAWPHQPQQFVDPQQLMDEMRARYNSVRDQEKLSTGDVLLYTRSGIPVHVVNHVVDNIVFTKNGVSKFNPYLFQYRETVERLYFPDGRFELSVFRPKVGGDCEKFFSR